MDSETKTTLRGAANRDPCGCRPRRRDQAITRRPLSESLRTDIRTVAEGLIVTNERLDRFESRVYEEFGELKAMLRLSFGELDRRLASR